VAVLLDRENRHLHDRIQALAAEIDRLKKRTAVSLQRELDRRPGADTRAVEKAPRRGHGPRVPPTHDARLALQRQVVAKVIIALRAPRVRRRSSDPLHPQRRPSNL
jgi:hypothetical protein